MIQFNEDEVCELHRALDYIKDATGSEYMWDKYTRLQNKVRAYGEEISETSLHCEKE